LFIENFLIKENSFFNNNLKVVKTLYAKKIVSLFQNLFSYKSEIGFREKKNLIIKIVNDSSVLKIFETSLIITGSSWFGLLHEFSNSILYFAIEVFIVE
jgi:hypothetical protein